MDRAQAQSQATSLVKEGMKSMPQASEAVESVREYASQGMDFVKGGLDDLRSNAKRVVSASESTIRENPFYAVLGAAALGIAIGAFLTRGRRD